MKKEGYVLVNFGGPRSIEEIALFLKALLTDQEVIRTQLPKPLHNFIFTRVAKQRAKKIAVDYELIGGKSPIFDDTEKLKKELEEKLHCPIVTFHRYLPSTHALFLKEIACLEGNIRIFPLFPQFSYATTGSIARWFDEHLCGQIVNRMRWVKSYAGHPAFINSWCDNIRAFLKGRNLKEEETILLFSSHGIPKKFVCTGDIYQSECELSFYRISKQFPRALSKLSYQSKFGKGEWLRPYTDEICEDILSWQAEKKQVVFVPLSFTSDHIETLYEIEKLYLPIIEEKGLKAYRCPAINSSNSWAKSVELILGDSDLLSNQMLLRHKRQNCCKTKKVCRCVCTC